VQHSGADEHPQPVHDGASQSLASSSETDVTTTEVPPEPPFLSIGESAQWLCVSPSTVKRLIAKGELSVIHVGKRRKVPANYLAAYVARDLFIPDESIDAK
jgi:excisionase family DNA binding protein